MRGETSPNKARRLRPILNGPAPHPVRGRALDRSLHVALGLPLTSLMAPPLAEAEAEDVA